MRRARTRLRLPWQIAFVLLTLIWGSSFWWISWGLESFTPIQVALGRNLTGGLCLFAAALASGVKFPRDRTVWLHIAVTGLLINAIPGAMVAAAQTTVSSSFAAVMSSASPLVVLVATITVFKDQRPTRNVIVGLVVSFAGVLIFLGVWQAAPAGQWWGIAALLAAVVSVGIGWPYFAHFLGRTTSPPLAIVAGQVILAAAFLLPLAAVEAVLGGGSVDSLGWQAVSGVLALGIVAGAVGNSLNFSIIRSAGPAITSMITYAVPVVAVVIGVCFLGEHLTWFELVGGAVVLGGIALAQERFGRTRRLAKHAVASASVAP